jgi:hypothetical protein
LDSTQAKPKPRYAMLSGVSSRLDIFRWKMHTF